MSGQDVWSRNLTLKAHFGANKHADALGTLYFALFRGDPSGAGVEPSSTGNYARVAKTNDATLWGTIGSTDVFVQNKGTSGEIAWPVATGLYSITLGMDWWGIFDNSSGGNLRYWGKLTTPIVVSGSGDQPRIPVNTLINNQPA